VAPRDDLAMRRSGSAFGTKRKWAGRQDRLTRSKMTHSGHRLDRNPAVQQSPAASDWVQHRGVGSARLDSEQFRSAPRTARPLGGRLIVREFSISTEGDSTMNAQTVQDRRGWAPDIGGMVLYSVLVLLVTLLWVYVPA
jgi:hypothetical protein